jgi:hypothetical protein
MSLLTALTLALSIVSPEDSSRLPALPSRGHADTVLVEAILVSTQARILIEAVTQDSTILLPADPLYQLLGLGTPASSRVTPELLQAAYPSTRIVWVPLEGRLYVFDPLETLPASRRAKAEVAARMQNSFSLPVQSGPFAAFAVDDSLHKLLEAGYNWRGRVAVAGRVDDAKAGSWGATLAPNSHVFFSYTDAVARPPTMSGRIAAGPLWLSASHTPHSPVDMSGLFRVGDVQVFASKQYGVLTINRPSQVAFQLATNWEQHRTAARVSVGPSYASPFSFPTTTLDRRSK